MEFRSRLSRNQLTAGAYCTDGALLDSGKHMVDTRVMLGVALGRFRGNNRSHQPSARPVCNYQASPCGVEGAHDIADHRLPLLGSDGGAWMPATSREKSSIVTIAGSPIRRRT